MLPATARATRTGVTHSKLRWVNNRWNPTVIPRPVTVYMNAIRARSRPEIPFPQKYQIARKTAAKGVTMVTTAARRS
jgi:hypothetical protein